MGWKHRTVAQEFRIVGLSGTHPQSQIARLVGVSKWTVADVQRKYHIVQRFGRSYGSARFRYAYDEHAWGRVLEYLYVELRLSQAEVAERLGVDLGTVRRRMRTLGFHARSPGEGRRGRKRGPYNWKWPPCATEGCPRRVATPGEACCAICRRGR